MDTIQIAIDGPAGSGKSTISKIVARKLDIIYLDTGAMYRGITYKAMKEGIKPENVDALKALLNKTDITFHGDTLILDGVNCAEEIRHPKISENVSSYAAVKVVREDLVNRQQYISKNHSIIMDGRDIGTVVLPNATYKVYLTASVIERAERRYKELMANGHEVDIEFIKEDIEKRDYSDMNRKESPLKKADDAVVVDTTGRSIEQVVEAIIEIVKRGK
jgi:cytidylate kinase